MDLNCWLMRGAPMYGKFLIAVFNYVDHVTFKFNEIKKVSKTLSNQGF